MNESAPSAAPQGPGADSLLGSGPTTPASTHVFIDTGNGSATMVPKDQYDAAVAAMGPAKADAIDLRSSWVGQAKAVEGFGGLSAADATIREAVSAGGFPAVLGKPVANALIASANKWQGASAEQIAANRPALISAVTRATGQSWEQCVADAKVTIGKLSPELANKLANAMALETPEVFLALVNQGKRLAGR